MNGLLDIDSEKCLGHHDGQGDVSDGTWKDKLTVEGELFPESRS